MNDSCSIVPDAKLGQDLHPSNFINLYGCKVGAEIKIGAFVEIQKNVPIANGQLQTEQDWKVGPTVLIKVRRCAPAARFSQT